MAEGDDSLLQGIALIQDKSTESSVEDQKPIDVVKLKEFYFNKIDKIRSQGPTNALAAAKAKENKENHINNEEVTESRAHAFYRLVGFPVVGTTGGFYNPGFNPGRSSNASELQATVDESVDINIIQTHQSREFHSRERTSIFKNQTISSAVYGIVLPIFKPFQVMNPNIEYNAIDNQLFIVPDRGVFVSNNFKDGDGNDISEFHSVGFHILKPFLVDHYIEETVSPPSRLVCEPFLAKLEDTLLEENVPLPRPIIEEILIDRLREFDTSANKASIAFELGADVSDIDSELSDAELTSIINALLKNNKIDQEYGHGIDSTSLEVANINNLIQTIKGLIDALYENKKILAEVRSKITWTPVPKVNGPEFGSEVLGVLSPIGATSDIERQIITLRTKKISDELSVSIRSNSGIYNQQSETEEDELTSLEEKKSALIRKGAAALANIEIIVGEISGFGLVDIMAIYTALWAIDIEVLISLLDDAAFERLQKNRPELESLPVENRRTTKGPAFPIGEALNRFEAQVISILSFADDTMTEKLGSPRNAQGGDPTSRS